jgi:hypothetical protein
MDFNISDMAGCDDSLKEPVVKRHFSFLMLILNPVFFPTLLETVSEVIQNLLCSNKYLILYILNFRYLGTDRIY